MSGAFASWPTWPKGAAGHSGAGGGARPVPGWLARFRPELAVTSGGFVDSLASVGGTVASVVLGVGGTRPALTVVSGKSFLAFTTAAATRLQETASALAAALGNVAPYTAYCSVSRTNPGGGMNGTFFGWCEAAGLQGYCAHLSFAPARDQYSRSEVGGATVNLITPGDVFPVGTRFVLSATYDGASYVCMVNGAVVASGASAPDIGPSNIFALGAYVISAGVVGGHLDGLMGDTFFYPGVHTAAQVAQQVRYLQAEYP